MRNSHLPPLFRDEVREFHSRSKLGGAANKLLLPSPSYATYTLRMQITNPSNLPRVVVMETVEDNVQGHKEGVKRQRSALELSQDEACHRRPGVRGREGTSGGGWNQPRLPPPLPPRWSSARGENDCRGGV